MQATQTFKNLFPQGFFAKDSIMLSITDPSFEKQSYNSRIWNIKSKTKLVILTVLTLISAYSKAESFGIGAVLGDPTGVSTKMWLDKTHAIDGAFAWSLSGPNALHVQSDYLIHELSFFHLRKFPLNLYYGAGGRLSSYSSKNKSGL